MARSFHYISTPRLQAILSERRNQLNCVQLLSMLIVLVASMFSVAAPGTLLVPNFVTHILWVPTMSLLVPLTSDELVNYSAEKRGFILLICFIFMYVFSKTFCERYVSAKYSVSCRLLRQEISCGLL